MVSNSAEWVVDSRASQNICTNRDFFLEYEKVTEGICVFMSDSTSRSTLSKGKVSLK